MGKDKAPGIGQEEERKKKTNTVTIMNIKYTLTLIGEVKPGGDITIQDHAKALKTMPRVLTTTCEGRYFPASVASWVESQ